MENLAAMPIEWYLGATILGYVISVLKQWRDAKLNGATVDFAFVKSYFVIHWLDTIIAVLGTAAFSVVAIELHQLTIMGALTAGYTGNSIADFLTGSVGQRSRLIANQIPPGPPPPPIEP
jgi:hypothetical protein